jgi:predicted esterase
MSIRRAIYCICSDGGGIGGPNRAYINLEKTLTGYYDVIHVETIPKSVSLNVANLLNIIRTNLDKYDEIFIIGWGMGGAVAIQTTFFTHNYIKPAYIKGIILLATQHAHTELISYIDTTIVFVHGNIDKVVPWNVSQRLYDNYNHQKHICIIPNQNHAFRMPTSDITDVLKQYFI